MRGAVPLLFLLVFLLLLPAAASAQNRPSAPRLDEGRITRLEAGEKLVYATVEQMNRGEVVGVIDATMEEVFAVLEDMDRYTRWYPDQRAAALISRTENAAQASGEVHLPFPFPNRTYIVDIDGEERVIDGVRTVQLRFQYVPGSGNFNDMYGFWWLQPWQGNDQRTLVRFVLNADLGVWLPDFVIRWAQRSMLPGIVDGLRREVVLRR